MSNLLYSTERQEVRPQVHHQAAQPVHTNMKGSHIERRYGLACRASGLGCQHLRTRSVEFKVVVVVVVALWRPRIFSVPL